jgi:hypothetical protein
MPTVYRNLGVTTEQVPGEDTLFAGSSIGRAEESVLIATGQPALARGTILVGTHAAATAYAGGGVGTVIGILGVDTPAATGGDVPSFVYKTGEFNEDLLVGFDEAARPLLRALNIYAKKVD